MTSLMTLQLAGDWKKLKQSVIVQKGKMYLKTMLWDLAHLDTDISIVIGRIEKMIQKMITKIKNIEQFINKHCKFRRIIRSNRSSWEFWWKLDDDFFRYQNKNYNHYQIYFAINSLLGVLWSQFQISCCRSTTLQGY